MGFLQHTLGIMFRPASEWKSIRNENQSFIQVYLSHVPFLALIPVVCAYIGVTQVGWSVGDGQAVRLTPRSAITLCAITYFALLGFVYVLGEFINWMSKTYGVSDSAEKRHYEGTALAVYVSTPVFLAGVANLYPELWFVAVVMGLSVCYAAYLLYEGVPILMNISKEQGFMYATSVITVGFVLAITVLISTVVIWGMGVGPVYVN